MVRFSQPWAISLAIGFSLCGTSGIIPTANACEYNCESKFIKKQIAIIEGPAGNGTATIIGRSGGRYTFLTSGHAIPAGSLLSEYDIFIPGSNKRLPVTSITHPLGNKADIAVGTFASSKEIDLNLNIINQFYSVQDKPHAGKIAAYVAILEHYEESKRTDALLTPLQRELLNQYRTNDPVGKKLYQERLQRISEAKQQIERQRTWAPGKGTPPCSAYENNSTIEKEYCVSSVGARIGGYSNPSDDIEKPVFRFVEFALQSRVYGNKEGYEIFYEAATYPGMSGSPVLGGREGFCRGLYYSLIGIHGKSEEYAGRGFRSGISMAVPVDLITGYLRTNAKALGIPTESKEIDKIIKKQYCQ